MRIVKTVLIGLATTVGLVAAAPRTAEARTYHVKLPVKELDSDLHPELYSMFGCTDFMACVSNFNELNDDDIGVGIFARYNDQWIAYNHKKIAEVSAPNWSRATGVNQVALISGLQSTQGQACTDLTVTAKDSAEEWPSGTQSRVCQVPSDGAISHLMNITPPGGATWTPASVGRTLFTTTFNRRGTSGPRGYVAAVYIRVSYQAP